MTARPGAEISAPPIATGEIRARYGFDRADVGLHNWRERPWNSWAFERVSEIVPSALVQGTRASRFPRGDASDILDEPAAEGADQSIGDALSAGQSDHLLVARDGRLIAEWHAPCADASRPHLLFSITKSVTALLVGVLEDARILDVTRAVAHYLPQSAASAFGDATVRDVLDMRVSLDFREEYLNRDGDYARYRRAMLWNPRQHGDCIETLADLLFSLKKGKGPHGGPFHYQSPNSDLIGLLVERVTGMPYADLLSQTIWQPLGCAGGFITVDAAGNPRGAGGFSARGEDLLRLGQMLLDGGSADGRQILSERWLADLAENGDEAAWAAGNYHDFLPGGRYRSQWYMPARPSRVIMAIGIHGQWLWLCPERRIAIVKLSSQAQPQNDALDQANLALLARIANLAACT